MWIARDENGELCIFRYKPEKSEENSLWMISILEENTFIGSILTLRLELFPEVTWDTEPKWTRVLDLNWIDYEKTLERDIEIFLSKKSLCG